MYNILPEDKDSKSPFIFGYEYECWAGYTKQKREYYCSSIRTPEPPKYKSINHHKYESFCAQEGIYGYEFKSELATINTHKKYFDKELSQYIKEHGVFTNYSGIHISFKRTENLNKQWNKITDNLLISKFQKQLFSLGQRVDNRYSMLTESKDQYLKSQHNYVLSTRKGLLFEFRLFSASPDNLFGAMEMLETMFLSAEDIKEQQLNINSYIEYTKSKEKEYPVINQLIRERIT